MCGLSVVLYAKILNFDILFGWDDELYLLRRQEVLDWFGASWSQRLLTPKTGYPVPVPTLLYALVWKVPDGLLLSAAHGLSLLFHVVNVAFVAMLGRRWLGNWRWAIGVCLIWSTHPLLVESVAWLTNLKGLTASACILGSVLLWGDYLVDGHWTRAGGVIVLGLVGLGCRPEAVMIGPILVSHTLIEDWKSWREPKVWVPLGILAVIGVGYLPIAMSGQQELLSGANRPELLRHTWWETTGRIFTAFGLQLEHIVWPVDLSPVYTRYYDGWRADLWTGVVGYSSIVAATIFALWRRHSHAIRGLSLFWWIWIPASGIVFLPRFTADTYMYLPLVGLLIGTAAILKEELRFAPDRKAFGAIAVAAILAIPLGIRSHQYTAQWEDTESLFKPLTYRQQDTGTVFAILTYDYIRRKKWGAAKDTIERGLDPLYDDAKLSLEMVKVFTKTGEPARAADLLMKMFRPAYPADLADNLHAYFVWLLPKYDIPLPKEGSERDQFRESAQRGLGHFRSQRSAEAIEMIAGYMKQHEMIDLADDYASAARELESSQP